MIGAGIAVRYIIARRRFNRRGIGGLQHYRSFERGIVTTIIEWALRWVAILVMLYGFFTLLAGLHRRDEAREAAQEQVMQEPPGN